MSMGGRFDAAAYFYKGGGYLITATFYNFPKRENSTKQPTGAGAEIPISIKIPSTIEDPTLEIHADVRAYNYVYIAYYGRYYFITDRECIAESCYIVTCRCDTLASFKAELAGQTVFAEYASFGFSQWLVDPRVNKTQAISVHREAALIELFDHLDVGGLMIRSFCRVIAEGGALNGYEVIQGNTSLQPLINKLSRKQDLQTLMLDIGGADPFDSICEIWDSPLEMSKCHNQTANGNVTVWEVQIGGRRLLAPDLTLHRAELNLHHNDQYNDFRDDWLIYNLFIPYVGVINLPTEICNVCDTVLIRYAADCTNGQIAYSVNLVGDETIPIGTYGACLKSPNAMSRQQGSEGRWAAGAMSVASAGVAAGLFTGSPVAGIAAAGAAELATFIGMAGPGKMEQAGSFTGGLACCSLLYESDRFILEVMKPGTVTEPSHYTANGGRPVQKYVTIQNGFIKARNASVEISGTDGERTTINALLNGGAYYE